MRGTFYWLEVYDAGPFVNFEVGAENLTLEEFQGLRRSRGDNQLYGLRPLVGAPYQELNLVLALEEEENGTGIRKSKDEEAAVGIFIPTGVSKKEVLVSLAQNLGLTVSIYTHGLDPEVVSRVYGDP